jgi:hypothetical protein
MSQSEILTAQTLLAELHEALKAAWEKRSLPHDVIPTELAQRVTTYLDTALIHEGAGLEMRARAWEAISVKLLEINPRLFHARDGRNGLRCALDAIDRMHQDSNALAELGNTTTSSSDRISEENAG